MKIANILRLSLLILIILSAHFLEAADLNQKHGVLVGANYWFSAGGENDLKSTIGFGGCYQYHFMDKLSLSIGMYYFAPSNEAASLPSGAIRLMPLVFNAQYTRRLDTFSPYVSGGIAYFLLRYSLSSDTVAAFDELGFDIESSANNKLGFNIGGGTYITLNPKYDLFVDFRYFIAKSSFTNTITDRITSIKNENSQDISLNSLAIGGGIRFNF